MSIRVKTGIVGLDAAIQPLIENLSSIITYEIDANQGSVEKRYQEFVDAVRHVYSSAMNEGALVYRKNRGLFNEDEQMAILIQRVCFINPVQYADLSEQDKYEVGKIISKINSILKNDLIMLMAPGRLGTTTPSLGLPVNF